MPTLCLENLINMILHPSSVFPYLFDCELIPKLAEPLPKEHQENFGVKEYLLHLKTSQRGSMGFKSGEDGRCLRFVILSSRWTFFATALW